MHLYNTGKWVVALKCVQRNKGEAYVCTGVKSSTLAQRTSRAITYTPGLPTPTIQSLLHVPDHQHVHWLDLAWCSHDDEDEKAAAVLLLLLLLLRLMMTCSCSCG
jgi:hypothetical protein